MNALEWWLYTPCMTMWGPPTCRIETANRQSPGRSPILHVCVQPADSPHPCRCHRCENDYPGGTLPAQTKGRDGGSGPGAFG